MSIRKIFKVVLTAIGILLLLLVLGISGVYLKYQSIVRQEPEQVPKAIATGFPLAAQVNTFIGTGGIPWTCAYNYPGASVPFGVMRLSPETSNWLTGETALNTSGYYYGDNTIIGFSHTRLSGTGATDGGHFLVLPGDRKDLEKKDVSGIRFSHKNEMAYPGYYSVDFKNLGIKAELSCTEHVGIHRYTFSNDAAPGILLDVTHALGGKRSEGGYIKVDANNSEMEGHVRTFGSFGSRFGGLKVYFAAKFSVPFAECDVWKNDSLSGQSLQAAGEKIRVLFNFENSNKPIELKLAISHVSIENARQNLESETGGKHFDEISREATEVWENRLKTIKITGGTKEQKTIFYTALYRSFQMPTVFSDVNGQYIGFDKAVHQADSFRYFTDMSIWDTFRTVHPLFNLIAKKDQRDMIVSLVQMAKEGGWLPRWPSGIGYTNSMLGTASDIVISESYQKGIRDFDVQYAYQSMRLTALASTPKGSAFSGREGGDLCIKYGFCPADSMREAVSRTLEFAWSDYSIGLLAKELGYPEDARMFNDLSMNYKNVWNPETQYFQARNADGNFTDKFKPLLLTYLDGDETYTDDYVEGSALQWRWAPFFDAPGLISLFSDKEFFTNELNDFFANADPAIGHWNPGSYYWHGNEPDIHSPYLFNFVDRPDLTQKWVRWVLDNKYTVRYDGLDGNDDAGTLSAWYIFSSLGFYPIAGTDTYELGAPLFQRAAMDLGTGILKIETDNYAQENKYVKQIWLNDTLLDRTHISHDEIKNGATLRFEMTKDPNI